MSISRHHADWLSLVPASGPFLSLPVLMEAFPQGLEPHEPEHFRRLRQAFADWQTALQKNRSNPVPQREWVRFVLRDTLDLDEVNLLEGQAIPQTLQVDLPERHEFLRPDLVIVEAASKKPRMLVQVYPPSQNLTSYVAESAWKSSPDTRMTELLHGTGIRLGLVTNGEHWMLVNAPKGETTGYASWYATLWQEERITLQAFRSLLSASRFFNVPDDQALEALLHKSASNQQEVTDQLGYQVRRAVEVLIHSLDKADQDRGRELLAGVKEEVLYESALTVMMRLVFLFCAEERELIPSRPFPVYEENYSVSTISKQLRELADQLGEELLERRHDAWPRLLAAFRAVYGGIKHEDVHIPAYGGSLFNPDRFPFLEGRPFGTSWKDTEANPLPVDNRTVLHLLEALQLLRVKVPGGGKAEPRRLSFRALDIEQIGHVYEGLLDHTARRASEPYLGLAGTRDKEPELPLADLESRLAKSEVDFIKFVREETGKSESAIKKALQAEPEPQFASRLRTACQGDDALWRRVLPFACLIRLDSFDYPMVIPKGSVFVTAGTDRRSSGTHYTPRSLTEPIVQYTLEPLVYIGPAEGLPKADWKLKSAKELLDLKICDMACGSGAFLVQAARYMSERLLEAWDDALKANPTLPGITPEGTPSTGRPDETLIPTDPDERKTYAMRLIAQRCLYGVDKNPLAAEMAKLSLWLLTVAKDKPFEFLDHAIRCGDSLVGLSSIEQLKAYSLRPEKEDDVKFFGSWLEGVDEAMALRLKLEEMPANSVEDVARQEKLLQEASDKMARLRCAADLLVAAEFWGTTPKDKQERVRHAAVVSGHYVEHGPTEEFQVAARKAWSGKEGRGNRDEGRDKNASSSTSTANASSNLPLSSSDPSLAPNPSPLAPISPFHWPLEFPEVIIQREGFDAFVGNPPFMGGQKLTGTLGEPYREYIVEHLAEGQRGSADLCAYFFLRNGQLVRPTGQFGLLATNTIAQGDTREVGLDQLTARGFSIPRAVASQPWPGVASLEVAEVWVRSGTWSGDTNLDGKLTAGITSFLTVPGSVSGKPYRLKANEGKSFQGSIVLGMGFVLSPEEAQALIDKDPRNKDVLFPYLNGEDLNSRPDQSPSRWVINFFDWPIEKAMEYPDCFRIVEEKVKPERMKNNRKVYRDKWWQYAEKRPELYRTIAGMDRVLVVSLISNKVPFEIVSSSSIFAHKLGIFALPCDSFFPCLQSSFHYHWCWNYCSTMRTDLNYSPSDCFETFPFPDTTSCLASICTRYRVQRSHRMMLNLQGLTKTYNLFHNPSESSTDIQKLRDLHVEMDQAVAAAYGWDDLALDHGFHETKQGLRFTISEPARREVLQRLLKLNHERYAEEVAAGLHEKKKTGSGKRGAGSGKKKEGSGAQSAPRTSDPGPRASSPSLFGDDDEEG
jgi:hypothetical protein